MYEERNQYQITRKDARGCFVESLSDAFPIGKAHFAFATYDISRPAGQRLTNNIHIYIDLDEILELCRKLECGELRYLLQTKKKNNDKTPLYQCLGGTSAEKLAKAGRPGKTEKACPERLSFSWEVNPIFCLLPTVALERQTKRDLLFPSLATIQKTTLPSA